MAIAHIMLHNMLCVNSMMGTKEDSNSILMELFSRRRWATGSAQQLWNYAMHVLHNFLGFYINTTAFCLGRSNLHLPILKSSMAYLIEQSMPLEPYFETLLLLWQVCAPNSIDPEYLFISKLGVRSSQLWAAPGAPATLPAPNPLVESLYRRAVSLKNKVQTGLNHVIWNTFKNHDNVLYI